MNQKLTLVFAVFFSVSSVSSVLLGQVDPVSITYSLTSPTPGAIAAAPELQGATVYDFFASTSSDILLINFDELEPSTNGRFYQDTFLGIDDAAPFPALFAAFPAIEFDGYITTPGDTSAFGRIDGVIGGMPIVLGENGIDGFVEAFWFDTTDDGPQENFHFARLTVIGDGFLTMRGDFQLRNDPTPLFGPFAISGSGTALTGATLIPEPTAGHFAVFSAIAMFLAFRTRSS